MIEWGGVGRYSANLLRHLVTAGSGHSFIAYCDPDSAHKVPDHPGIEKRIVSQPVFSVPAQVSWAREIKDSKVDLFHSPHFPVPLMYDGAKVTTIHDVIPLVYPQSMPSKAGRIYFRNMSRLATRRSHAVITVSQASKVDIVKHLKVSEDKVRVIYEAVEMDYCPMDRAAAKKIVADQWGVTDPFLLYVGAHKPHKNIPGLVKAYSQLEPAMVAQFPLVLAGEEDKRFPEVQQAIKKLKLRRSVISLGFVEEKRLAALYSASRALCYPSLSEGFGFPPLEAMACGAPVVASNQSCMPEVLGDGAYMVDVRNIGEFTEALHLILTDEDLRGDLRRRGAAKVAEYSWDRAAAETIAVYEELMS